MADQFIWKDRIVERPRTYTETRNPDGTVTFTPAEGQIIQEGTPVNAQNMQSFEDKIIAASGRQFTQPVEPTTFSDGDRWFDTSSRVLWIAANGEWNPVPPVTVTDEAVLFDGSDGEVMDLNGAIGLAGSLLLFSEHSVKPVGTSTAPAFSAGTRDMGWRIKTNYRMPNVQVRLGPTINWSESTQALARVVREHDNATLKEVNILGMTAGAVINFEIGLEADTTYLILARVVGNPQVRRWRDEAFPIEGDLFDIVGGWLNGPSQDGYLFDKIWFSPGNPTTIGTARVYHDHPSRIEAWVDVLARYRVNDGAVQHDVQQWDGNQWQTILSDVGEYAALFDLDPTKNTASLFTLTRPSADDESPRIDYVARRYVR